MPTLSDHIARIAQDEALPQRVEEAARQTAVLPVLDALGWNCWDGNEVTPEFEVQGGRVDYCLRDVERNRNLVLIEVKRAGTDLSGHQEQLLGYAFRENVSMAALTDGLVWWLYLPRADAHWEQRRFFSIDFRQQEADPAAANLKRFLSREGVASGTALREAQREFESQERGRRVRAALQQAWGRVLGDPEGLLRELLAEEVQGIAGHRPEPETIAEFLSGVSGSGGTVALPPSPSHPPTGEPAETTSGQKAAATRQKRMEALLGPKTHDWEYVRTGRAPNGIQSVTGARLKAYHVLRDRRTGDEVKVGRGEMIKYAGVEPPASEPEPPGKAEIRRKTPSVSPAAFRLDGESHEVTSWRWMLVALCERLAELEGDAFEERVANVRGRRRPYFSSSRGELRKPLRVFGTRLFVEGNVSAAQAERIARLTLIAVRGTDDGFRIELAE